MPAGPDPTAASDRLAQLRESARGWHGVQLAVLGFIGLCGVLTGDGSSGPTAVQVLAGLLALAALATACLATYLVARAAWPLYRPDAPASRAVDADEVRATSRRLTTGITLTFVAVALLALGTASGWWPSDDASEARGAVRVEAQGSSWCGRLGDARPGAVLLETGRGPVTIPVGALTRVTAVDRCA